MPSSLTTNHALGPHWQRPGAITIFGACLAPTYAHFLGFFNGVAPFPSGVLKLHRKLPLLPDFALRNISFYATEWLMDGAAPLSILLARF